MGFKGASWKLTVRSLFEAGILSEKVIKVDKSVTLIELIFLPEEGKSCRKNLS